MSWNPVANCWPLEGEEVRVLLQNGDITIGYWVKVEPNARRVWLDLLGTAILVVGWQRDGDKVAVPPGIISPNEVERRLLAFCRTVRVLPGDDLRVRSTWPEQWADIARRVDEELRWTDREDEPVRFIPSARDLDDVLVAGDWFARLRSLTATPAIAGPSRERATRGGRSPLPLGTAKRKPWSFTPEQKVVWWASFEPRPSWRLMAQWDGRVSHTTMRNRYNRAVGKAYDIANGGG